MSHVQDHLAYMREAVDMATKGVLNKDGHPFGCIIVKDGDIVGRGCNKTTSTFDPSAHGEVVAIRDACTRLSRTDLNGCDLYTSCEPCPMCMGCIYWARINKVYFGCSISDQNEHGFDYAEIFRDIVPLPYAERSIPFEQIGRNIAIKLFEEWSKNNAMVDNVR